MSASFVVTPSRAAPKRIVIRDAGGVISQAYKDVFYQPFTQATGIEVVSVSAHSNPTAQIKTIVESQRYQWDMATLGEMAILSLTVGSTYLEKHGLEHDPTISLIPSEFISAYGIGTNVYTTVLAYQTRAFQGRRAPESWQDLWDVEHFPGRRSLYKNPLDTTEIALMADGVPPDDVYPCDLNRAFRSLDKIKPHVAVWWTNGTQTEQLLKSGETDLIPVWISRVQATINAGAPVAFSWNQHFYGYISWAILKGTPNADACRQFIRFASDPKRQALLAPYMMGPTHPHAFNYMDLKQAKLLPSYPDNLKRGLHVDASYWLKNQSAALERFNDWLLNK